MKYLNPEGKEVLAIQWTGNLPFPEEFQDMGYMEEDNGYDLSVDEADGEEICKMDDYIVKSSAGFKVVRRGEFEKTYSKIEKPQPRESGKTPSRERQLEMVVKFAMKWLEDIGGIAAYTDSEGNQRRQACVADAVDDAAAAVLDYACEMALKGSLEEGQIELMIERLEDLDPRGELERKSGEMDAIEDRIGRLEEAFEKLKKGLT